MNLKESKKQAYASALFVTAACDGNVEKSELLSLFTKMKTRAFLEDMDLAASYTKFLDDAKSAKAFLPLLDLSIEQIDSSQYRNLAKDMVAVAISDGKFHDNESLIIATAISKMGISTEEYKEVVNEVIAEI
jgi:tellurite resistance protein